MCISTLIDILSHQPVCAPSWISAEADEQLVDATSTTSFKSAVILATTIIYTSHALLKTYQLFRFACKWRVSLCEKQLWVVWILSALLWIPKPYAFAAHTSPETLRKAANHHQKGHGVASAFDVYKPYVGSYPINICRDNDDTRRGVMPLREILMRFYSARLTGAFGTMQQTMADRIERWMDTEPTNFDISQTLSDVVNKGMFDVPDELSDELAKTDPLRYMPGVIINECDSGFPGKLRNAWPFLNRLPLPQNRRRAEAHAKFDELVEAIECVQRDAYDAGVKDTLFGMVMANPEERHTVENGDMFHFRKLISISYGAFVTSGYSTTLNILYHLARFPEVQERIFDELQAAINPNTGLLPSKVLSLLPHTRAFLKEVLRFGTPITALPRREGSKGTGWGGSAVNLPGYLGSIPFSIDIDSLNQSPSIWTSPQTFIPTRFSRGNPNKESEHNTENNMFCPFGMGKRKCPGENLAYGFMMGNIAQILRKFKLALKKDVELDVVHTTTSYWIRNEEEIVKAIDFEWRKELGRVDSAIDMLM